MTTMMPSANGPRRATHMLRWGASPLAVLALAWWTRSLAPAALVVAIVALAVATMVAFGDRRRAVGIALVSLTSVALAIGVRWWSATTGTVAATEVAAEAARATAIANARAVADAAAVASAAEGRPVMTALSVLPADVGVVVYRDSAAIGWAGRQFIATDALWERAGTVSTAFHTVAYAVAVRGTIRAVATVTLSVAPPADRLARSITGTLGSPALITLPASQRIERARVDGLLLLGVLTLVVLVTGWGRARSGGERVAALTVPLAALSVAPLNALSNVTRLFDPATYYVALGGPFTASIGALTLTSALVLFAVLAARRARLDRSRRGLAAVIGVVIAGAAPFLLRDLARGITMPRNGADTLLWLAWETGLFLAAMTLLIASVTMGQSALRRGRGVPLWVAPVLACVATLLAPVLLEGAGRWPDWYSLLWVAAISALAFAKRSRAILLPGAIVAACGAVILTWGATIGARVELATRDVTSIGAVDEGSLALLERFADDLVRGGAPRDRAALLTRYASADLADAEYPVSLAQWPPDAAPITLELGAEARWTESAALAEESRVSDTPLLRALPARPVAALALAVPHADGSVTTVIVGARTQLTRGATRAPVLGFPDTPTSSLYELSLRPLASSNALPRTPWVRRGDHLHADWRVTDGERVPVQIHARVGFDAYDSLLPRGALVVLINLALVALLWGFDVSADGALMRWVRARRGRWRRSYRLQLTVALFAFFVVPAGVFALWTSRRLQADDRASRELLAREVLRRASLVMGPSGPVVVGIPTDVPQFLYRSGRLIAASDSLQLAVAPIGRWLDPAVHQAMGDGEDLVATRPIRIGDRSVLFGFRPIARDLVVAVPARVGDDALDQRRRDLGVLVLLSTILGALAALGLSGFAARRLARPIGTLRDAALAVAGGRRADLALADAAVEFAPVFDAFDTMARDLAASEAQVARAQRVFAWGEMARQIAHEIKNPLTPMRLGMQHLLRAWRDGRPDFGQILEENAQRVLAEIDHLDATARSFSQFGAPPEARAPVLVCDVAAVCRDVLALERLGNEERKWTVVGADVPTLAMARPHELREVLINLGENARMAGAQSVVLRVQALPGVVRVSVEDDGAGVPADVLPRVFEPHFSTHTSGSGLGLAISRRLVEEWGGSIRLTSEPGEGTVVAITLRRGTPSP
jgi:signal transduction histidine kinase